MTGIHEFLTRLAPEDQKEFELMGYTPEHVIAGWEAATGKIEVRDESERLMLIAGVYSPDKNAGWWSFMLMTKEIQQRPLVAMKAIRRIVSLGEAQSIWAIVGVWNTKTINWLTKLGFTLSPPLPMGPYNALWHIAHKDMNYAN